MTWRETHEVSHSGATGVEPDTDVTRCDSRVPVRTSVKPLRLRRSRQPRARMPGRVTWMRQPRGDSATPMRPPCRSTAQRAMARPSPVPPSLARSVRRRWRCPVEALEDPVPLRLGDAGPLVQHLQHQAARTVARAAARTVTRPCGGLCLTALSIRLATTWCSRSASA